MHKSSIIHAQLYRPPDTTLITKNSGHLDFGPKNFGHINSDKCLKKYLFKKESRVETNFGHFNFGQSHLCPKLKTSEIFGN